MPDALIAATALEYKLNRASRNSRDFGKVHGLWLHNSVDPGGETL